MINFENMATNVNNAERLRSYFFLTNKGKILSMYVEHAQIGTVVTIVTYIQVQGFHVGSKMINIIVANQRKSKQKTRMYERKSETKDLAMTPKEQEMDLRRWCVEVSVKICDKESIIEVAEKLYKWITQQKMT